MTSPFSLDVLSDLAVGSKILSTYLEGVEQQIEQLFRHTHQLAPGDFKIDSTQHRETELRNIDRCGSPGVFIDQLSGHIEEFTRALKRFCYEVPYIQKIYEEDYRGFERPETEGAGWLATLKRASDRRIETLCETYMGANAILRFLQEAPHHYQETSSLELRPPYDITSSETP
jgi:hypothetical protein